MRVNNILCAFNSTHVQNVNTQSYVKYIKISNVQRQKGNAPTLFNIYIYYPKSSKRTRIGIKMRGQTNGEEGSIINKVAHIKF
jgi:hypothetical protein